MAQHKIYMGGDLYIGGGGTAVQISKEEGNVLENKTDGLYVPAGAVEISKEEGNIIEPKDDGIYAKDHSKTKILEINAVLTEQELLDTLKENEGYECSGFWYNADEDCYCEFEGLYSGHQIGTETVHFGYCHIRGVHKSDYNVDYYIDDEDGELWYKKTPEDYINLDNYATKEDLNKIEMFKTPNAIIHGEPTINNGQISNFSSNDYLVLPFEFNSEGKAFEISMAFTTKSNVTTPQNLLGSNYCIAAYISNSHLTFRVSSNGTSWDAINYTTDLVFEPNKTYYIKFVFDRLSYKIFYSLDGKTYSQDGSTIISTLEPKPGEVYIGVGNNFNNPFLGIINLNKCEIKFNNIIFWEGMDDAGLATRLATDLENIDELGVQKILEIIANNIEKEDIDFDNFFD